jgi:hypothetical protein
VASKSRSRPGPLVSHRMSHRKNREQRSSRQVPTLGSASSTALPHPGSTSSRPRLGPKWLGRPLRRRRRPTTRCLDHHHRRRALTVVIDQAP